MIERVPLGADELRAQLEAELTRFLSERPTDDAPKLDRLRADTAELRLRTLLGTIRMMEEVAAELGSDVATLSIAEEHHRAALIPRKARQPSTSIAITFRLEPTSPSAAPVAVRVFDGDDMSLLPGHGEVWYSNVRLDDVDDLVLELRGYVDLVIQGKFREVYWAEGYGADTRVLSAKTYFLRKGRWRRAGQLGGRRDGQRVAREYEPYR